MPFLSIQFNILLSGSFSFKRGVMQYFGGKNRSGKEIATKIINRLLYASQMNYVEPFVGSGGVFKHTIQTNKNGETIKKDISDLHYFVYAMHKFIAEGGDLKEFGEKYDNKSMEELYNRLKAKYKKNISLKDADVVPDGVIGYIGFQCSFLGHWFRSYANNKRGHFYYNMGFSNDKNQYLNTTVHNKSYNEFKSINSVIYCDPPYSDTAGYSVGKFNHEEFYDWVRNESKNNIVLISEFKAPEDFICIYSFEFTQGAGNSARVTEKVFTHKSALKNEIIKELYEKENSKVKTEQFSLF